MSLLPLYSTADEDRPDNLLGSYPNANAIVEALKTLIDVMSGKDDVRPIGPRRFEIFLIRRLSEAGICSARKSNAPCPFAGAARRRAPKG
jgi:hypothetical protein